MKKPRKKTKDSTPPDPNEVVGTSLTCEQWFKEAMERRASDLGISVSQYLRALAADDMATQGDLVLRKIAPPDKSDAGKTKPDADKQ